MKIGVMMFPTDKAIQPVELARAVEERGFESLWFPEHSHIPASRATPWGGRKNAPELPEEYWRTHDQFVALGACAAVTENIKLGSGICLVAQRDPIWLAKQIASLDVISGGRFLFGIGYGWNVEEMNHHGYEFKNRRERLRDNVLLMKQLWTQDEAAYRGDHAQLEKSWAWPKPAQKPHPPVILGAAGGPRSYAQIVEFCDGWMPIGGMHDFEGGLKGIQAACKEAGRDPSSIEIGMFGASPDADQLKAFEELGLRRAVLPLPPAPADEVLPLLDQYTRLMS